jgi:HTH-type transcriptional regulator / antitoxin HigA
MPVDTMIRPIRSDADHAAAMLEVERLWGAKDGTADGDRLDIIATLIATYEDQRWQFAKPDAVSAIEFRLEQQGLSRKDLEPFIGSRARVSEIMNRKRPLTLAMIRKLAAGLAIPTDALIRQP